jgi:hypothetical protein
VIKVAKTHKAVRLLMDNPPAWAKFTGVAVDRVHHNMDGTTIIRLGRTPEGTEDRFRVVGSDNGQGRLFQFAGRDLVAKFPNDFGLTEAKVLSSDDNQLVVEVPAERSAVRNRPVRNPPAAKPAAKAASTGAKPSKAVATVKSALKTMGRESPPPGFTPAIPLREAIDTINAYKVTEGDMLELTISRRGRLKVSYEYGG